MPYLIGFHIEDHPKIKPLTLDMNPGDDPFRHLIITGRNGTGKTTLLNGIWEMLSNKSSYDGRSRITLSANGKQGGTFIVAFLEDQHKLTYREQIGKVPEPIEPLNPGENRAASRFVPYLKHQYLQMLLAKANNEESLSLQIEARINRLTDALADLFEINGMRMQFNSKTYELKFVEPDGAAYNFSQLSAGLAAVLEILGELLVRIKDRDPEDAEGTMLIDEIDAHLHPRIQEKILPFLTQMFPKIQFIVATHSPAVVGSISKAVVFDLDKMESELSEVYQDLPYGQVMISHFGLETDVGDATTKSLREAEALIHKSERSTAEEARLKELLKRLRKTGHPLIMAAYSRQIEKRVLEGQKKQ